MLFGTGFMFKNLFERELLGRTFGSMNASYLGLNIVTDKINRIDYNDFMG